MIIRRWTCSYNYISEYKIFSLLCSSLRLFFSSSFFYIELVFGVHSPQRYSASHKSKNKETWRSAASQAAGNIFIHHMYVVNLKYLLIHQIVDAPSAAGTWRWFYLLQDVVWLVPHTYELLVYVPLLHSVQFCSVQKVLYWSLRGNSKSFRSLAFLKDGFEESLFGFLSLLTDVVASEMELLGLYFIFLGANLQRRLTSVIKGRPLGNVL